MSGVLKGAVGYKVLLVQANGKARKATIRTAAGSFSISGAKPAGATLQLVKPDGSYFGPVVLKATATKAYAFIKGAANLKLALDRAQERLRAGAESARAAGTRRSRRTRQEPSVAGRSAPASSAAYGPAKPMGLRGAGADLDLDGVVSAFDIDDNGNLLLDNVDRTGRGAARPRAGASGAAAPAAVACPRPAENRSARRRSTRRASSTCSPTSGRRPSARGRRCPAASINANIAAIADLDALIDRYLPMALTLAMEAPDGTPAQLDGLDNAYIGAHTRGRGHLPARRPRLRGADVRDPRRPRPASPTPATPSGCRSSRRARERRSAPATAS